MHNNEFSALLDFLMRPATEYNMQDNRFFGVLFHQKSNKTISAIVASAFYVVEVENVSMSPKGEFFRYRMENEKESWHTSPYPKSGDEILQQFARFYPEGSIRAPLPNLINHIGKFHDDVKKRSRIIFSPGIIERDCFALKFVKESDGISRARVASVKKAIVPINGPFPPHFGEKPDYYVCKKVRETESEILVDVINIYGKVKVGINHSPHGFVVSREDMSSLNLLTKMDPELICCIQQTQPKGWLPHPTHFDCMMFYDLLKVFLFSGAHFIDIFFGNSPNSPVVIKNVKRNPEDIGINVIVAPLNQEFGPQRR